MTDDSGSIVTVMGRIDPGDLGITMTHEHLFIDTVDAWYQPPNEPADRALAENEITLKDLWYVRRNSLYHRDNVRLDDLEEGTDEAKRYHRAGGDAIVDVTPKNTGDDPRRVRAVARETGLNIIHGTVYYTQGPHPDHLEDLTGSNRKYFRQRCSRRVGRHRYPCGHSRRDRDERRAP